MFHDQTKLKGRMHGMKLKARRISTEFGTTVATAAARDGGSTGSAEGRKGALEPAAAAGDKAEEEGRNPRHRRRPSSTICVLS